MKYIKFILVFMSFVMISCSGTVPSIRDEFAVQTTNED